MKIYKTNGILVLLLAFLMSNFLKAQECDCVNVESQTSLVGKKEWNYMLSNSCDIYSGKGVNKIVLDINAENDAYIIISFALENIKTIPKGTKIALGLDNNKMYEIETSIEFNKGIATVFFSTKNSMFSQLKSSKINSVRISFSSGKAINAKFAQREILMLSKIIECLLKANYSGYKRLDYNAYSKYDDGSTQSLGKVDVNSLKTGQWKMFDEKGYLASEGKYLNNEKSGFWIYYLNGQKIETRNYVNGLREGECTEFYQNGNMYSEASILQTADFQGGNYHGKRIKYYENGQIHITENYLNGIFFGETKYYYENGKLKAVQFFENGGVREGEWKNYDENGILTVVSIFKEGDIINEKNYYENGSLQMEKELVYGNPDLNSAGKSTYYYPSGKIAQVGFYKDTYVKTGKFTAYYENEQLQAIGNYEEGNLTGAWKAYYDNGKLYEEGIYFNGLPNGTWNLYHQNGQIFQKRIWEQGKLMDVNSCFDVEGVEQNCGTLNNGSGYVNLYDEDGKLLRQVNFVNGVEVE